MTIPKGMYEGTSPLSPIRSPIPDAVMVNSTDGKSSLVARFGIVLKLLNLIEQLKLSIRERDGKISHLENRMSKLEANLNKMSKK